MYCDLIEQEKETRTLLKTKTPHTIFLYLKRKYPFVGVSLFKSHIQRCQNANN